MKAMLSGMGVSTSNSAAEGDAESTAIEPASATGATPDASAAATNSTPADRPSITTAVSSTTTSTRGSKEVYFHNACYMHNSHQ